MPPTGDQERLQFHFGKGRVTRTREFSGILAYRRVMLRLKLGLVWRGGSNARFRVAVQMVARVKRNEQCALALCRCLLNKFRSGDTKPVVRHGECVCGAQTCEKSLLELFSNQV